MWTLAISLPCPPDLQRGQAIRGLLSLGKGTRQKTRSENELLASERSRARTDVGRRLDANSDLAPGNPEFSFCRGGGPFHDLVSCGARLARRAFGGQRGLQTFAARLPQVSVPFGAVLMSRLASAPFPIAK